MGWYDDVIVSVVDEIVSILKDSTRTYLTAVKDYHILGKIPPRLEKLAQKGEFPYVFVFADGDGWEYDDFQHQGHTVRVRILVADKYTSDAETGSENTMRLYGDIHDELHSDISLNQKIDFIRDGAVELDYAEGTNFVLFWVLGTFNCIHRES